MYNAHSKSFGKKTFCKVIGLCGITSAAKLKRKDEDPIAVFKTPLEGLPLWKTISSFEAYFK